MLKRSLVPVVAASAVSAVLVVSAAAPPPARATPRTPTELAPDPAVVHYKLAIPPASETSDLEATIDALEQRIRDKIASPFDLADLAEAHFQSAQLSGDQEELDRAEALARQSLAILPYPNGVAVVLAKIESSRHEFREAIRIADAYVAHKPSASAEIVLASAHLALGELDQASDAADKAVAMKPDASSYLMQALVLQARGRDVEAASSFTRAVEHELPGDVQESARARALWARFLIRRGELGGARMLADEALRIVPDHPLALAQKAEIALRTGKLKEARDGFERAFATSRQVRYLIDYARAQELSKDASGAASSRAQVEKLIRAELGTRGTGHKLDLVEVLTDRGTAADLALAIELGRQELAHRPSADTRFQLARAMYRSGDRNEAKRLIEAALATGVHDARLYELAARVETGPRKDEYAKAAIALDPGASGWRSQGMK